MTALPTATAFFFHEIIKLKILQELKNFLTVLTEKKHWLIDLSFSSVSLVHIFLIIN